MSKKITSLFDSPRVVSASSALWGGVIFSSSYECSETAQFAAAPMVMRDGLMGGLDFLNRRSKVVGLLGAMPLWPYGCLWWVGWILCGSNMDS